MKIMYLNVNGFFGNEEKNKIMGGKTIGVVRTEISEEKITTCQENLGEEICENEKTKNADMIFLSEVDPQSPATHSLGTYRFENKRRCSFIDTINKDKKYNILTPNGNESEKKQWGEKWEKNEWGKIPGYSCTICLKKKGLNYTNADNGFRDKGKILDYLQICKIENEKVVLLAIHAKDEKGFDDSISRLLEYAIKNDKKNDKKIIVFGDTNANPDAKKIEDQEAFERNRRFENFMKKLGLYELAPEGKPYTYLRKTRIDRVFTNMPKDKIIVEVAPTFLEKNLSDHVALLITYEED